MAEEEALLSAEQKLTLQRVRQMLVNCLAEFQQRGEQQQEGQLGLAGEVFAREVVVRAWALAEREGRLTVEDSDIAAVLRSDEQYDFLSQ